MVALCERVVLIHNDVEIQGLIETLVKSIGFEIDIYDRPLEFLNGFEHQGPGVILSDLIMSEMSGIELLRQTRRRHISLPFVIVTEHGDIDVAISALRSGAFDFIEKPFSSSAFLLVVQQAIEHSRQGVVVEAREHELEKRVADLTCREAEVVREMLSGASNKEIARALDISPRTVEHHRQSALRKLGVQSAVELCSLLLQTQLSYAEQRYAFGPERMFHTASPAHRTEHSARWVECFGVLSGFGAPNAPATAV